MRRQGSKARNASAGARRRSRPPHAEFLEGAEERREFATLHRTTGPARGRVPGGPPHRRVRPARPAIAAAHGPRHPIVARANARTGRRVRCPRCDRARWAESAGSFRRTGPPNHLEWAVRDARDGMRCKARNTAMQTGIASLCNAAPRPCRGDGTAPIPVIQWTRMAARRPRRRKGHVPGGAAGLQIRTGAATRSRVGSTPILFRRAPEDASPSTAWRRRCPSMPRQATRRAGQPVASEAERQHPEPQPLRLRELEHRQRVVEDGCPRVDQNDIALAVQEALPVGLHFVVTRIEAPTLLDEDPQRTSGQRYPAGAHRRAGLRAAPAPCTPRDHQEGLRDDRRLDPDARSRSGGGLHAAALKRGPLARPPSQRRTVLADGCLPQKPPVELTSNAAGICGLVWVERL